MCVCVYAAPPNDARANAVDLTVFVDSTGYWSSVDSGILFTNVKASADGPVAVCIDHNTANVWFKYEPDSLDFSITFEALTGNPPGSIRYLAIGISWWYLLMKFSMIRLNNGSTFSPLPLAIDPVDSVPCAPLSIKTR